MSQGTFQYLTGRGWLIFSGGNDPISEIRAQALSRAGAYGTTVYISLAGDGGDSLMDDMEDLGARSGYFIDLEFDDPETQIEQIQTASLVVIESGTSIDQLYELLAGAALSAIREAYSRGAVILVEGLAINLFGRWFLSDDGELVDAFDWVQNAFLEPESSGIEDSIAVRTILLQREDVIAISIGVGSALALGAGGHIEIWGEDQEVTISLGRHFVDDTDEPDDVN